MHLCSSQSELLILSLCPSGLPAFVQIAVSLLEHLGKAELSSYLLAWSSLVFKMQLTCCFPTSCLIFAGDTPFSAPQRPASLFIQQISEFLPWTRYCSRYMGYLSDQRSLTWTSLPSVISLNVLLMVDMSRPPGSHYAPQGWIDVLSYTSSIRPFNGFLLLLL